MTAGYVMAVGSVIFFFLPFQSLFYVVLRLVVIEARAEEGLR